MGLFGDDNLKKSDALRQWLEEDIDTHKPAPNSRSTPASTPKPTATRHGSSIDSTIRRSHGQRTTPSGHSTPRALRGQTGPRVDARTSHPRRNETGVEVPSRNEAPLVSVQLSIPKVRLPRPKITRRFMRGAGAVLAIGILLFAGWFFMGHSVEQTRQKQARQKTATTMEANLGFVPIAPPGKGKIVPGVSNPAYDKDRGIYYFKDEYNGIIISLTEQAVPEKLAKSRTHIEAQAKNIGATDSFTTTLGMVYASKYDNATSQRLMLANTYMLMFITSSKSMQSAEWVQYIENLERIK